MRLGVGGVKEKQQPAHNHVLFRALAKKSSNSCWASSSQSVVKRRALLVDRAALPPRKNTVFLKAGQRRTRDRLPHCVTLYRALSTQVHAQHGLNEHLKPRITLAEGELSRVGRRGNGNIDTSAVI